MSSVSSQDIPCNKNQFNYYILIQNMPKQIKNTIPCIITAKEMSQLRINLTKNIQDVYADSDKMLIKK